jgi:hypothetical protein
MINNKNDVCVEVFSVNNDSRKSFLLQCTTIPAEDKISKTQ